MTNPDPQSKPSVAVLGLGIMGAPMASNLARAGHDTVGWNRSPGRTDALVAAGGRAADSIAAAVADADVIITVVSDSPDVQQIAAGADGLIANARRGAVWIDCSTISPAVARALAEDATDAGLRALDAPVSGGEQGAVDGALSIMVGGDEAVVDEVRPVLDVLGATVVHVGSSGAGQTVKAANQLMTAGILELVSEALVFVEAHGVDPRAATRVWAAGLAGSRILEAKGEKMITREFGPGFKVDLHVKDLGIVTDAAREAGVAVPLAEQAADLMHSLSASGRGDLDHSALLLQVLEHSRGAEAG